MTDRRRLRCLSQALYVWHHDEPAAIFRHAAVHTRSHGLLGRPADCTLPAPMRLLLDGDVSDVPRLVEIDAARAGDEIHTEFRSHSYARLAQPSEVSLNRSTVLCETSGTAEVNGSINGERIDLAGRRIRVPPWLSGFRRCCGNRLTTSPVRCRRATAWCSTNSVRWSSNSTSTANSSRCAEDSDWT